MSEPDIIKATGTVTKEEFVVNISHNIMPDTLVLESSHPFPGYHGSNLPENPLPNTIYLVTETKYDGEEILRITKKIKKRFPEKFDASYGKLELFTNTFNFIRVRDIDCFDCIERIQKEFACHGIKFKKKKKIDGEASIRIQKFFTMEKIDDHIYRDLIRSDNYYFEIPEKPEWEFFKKVTFYIRGNVNNYSFDAALVAVYLEDIREMVRIYAQNVTPGQLRFVRDKYIYELTHPDHLK